MANEIEFKLDIDKEQTGKLLSGLDIGPLTATAWQSTELYNVYFDTPDLKLNQNHVAIRIRRQGEQFIQTVKSVTACNAGLHQRQEWEQVLASEQLDFDALPAALTSVIAADELKTVKPLFNTDFTRHWCLVTASDGSTVEVAVDTGRVKREGHEAHFNEVELELKSGDVKHLYDIAAVLVDTCDACLSNISKAERGFNMFDPDVVTVREEMIYHPGVDSSVEEGLYTALSTGLNYWQSAEKKIITAHSKAALFELDYAVRFVSHVIAIYSPIVLRRSSKSIRESLAWLQEEFSAFEKARVVKQLSERLGNKMGLYGSLPSFDAFSAHVHTANESLLDDLLVSTQALLKSRQYQHLVLSLGRWVHLREWRQHTNESLLIALNQTIGSFGKKQLNTHWKELKSAFASTKRMSNHDYFDQYQRIQKALSVGICFGSVFKQNGRDQFRQTWLDILAGIDEFRQLALVSDLNRELGHDQKDDVDAWINKQKHGITNALYETRKSALSFKPYWSR